MNGEPTTFSDGAIDERTLAALLKATTAINSSLELQAVLTSIAQSAADVLDSEASSVLLLDRLRKKLIFKAAVGASGAMLVGEEFDAGLGIAGRVAATGKPERVPDVHQHPDFYGAIDRKSKFTTRGMIAAPLRHRDQIFGVVEVLNKKRGEFFNDRDLEILQVFANMASIGVANAQAHENLRRENLGLREKAVPDSPIVGGCPSLRQVLELCDRVAPTNATVLLLGETGTGKELTARRVHDLSPRRERPFIAINCAALPETLLESELFGHEAGAFTGASGQKLGRFELADRGTLFLDEIGEMEINLQAKLLRAIQERRFERVAETKRSPRMCASYRQPIATCRRARETGPSARTCTTGLQPFRSSFPPCASVAPIFCCSPSTS